MKLALVGVVAFLLGGLLIGGVAFSAPNDPPATYVPPCTANTDSCRQQRIVALEKHYREHAHPAASPSASPTPSPSPDPSPSTSSAEPSGSPSGCVKPTAANTGASGTRTNSSASTLNTNGQVLENVNVPGDLIVNADNVTIRNVQTGGGILVNVSAVGTIIDRVTTEDIGLSSPDQVTIQNTRITAGDEHDALHVTGDSGRRVSNVVITNSLIDDPRPQGDAHYDGLQIRGVNGLLVQCNTFDLGPWQEQYTAAIYSEPANGGNTGVRVLDNWINGGGFAIYAESGNEFSRNRFGTDQRWGICYGNGVTPSGTGNVRDADNSPIDLVAECRA